MTALDEILKKIRTSAQSEAEKILDEADSKSKTIRSDAEAESERVKKEITAQIDKRIKEIEENTEKQAEIIKSQTVLEVKQNIISNIIDDYHNQLLNLSVNNYFNLLEKIISRYNLSGKTLLLNKKDLLRIPKYFSKLKIKISDIPADIDGGFILTDGEIEENCSFQSLFDSKRQVITEELNNLIFGDV